MKKFSNNESVWVQRRDRLVKAEISLDRNQKQYDVTYADGRTEVYVDVDRIHPIAQMRIV